MGNYFEELNNVNVSDRTEKKGNLTYLSWAWAWGEIKKRYPDATYTVYESEDGCFYHTDGRTGWVKTGVTVNEIEHIEYLPIMDFRNNSIPLDKITSMDAIRAIQRAVTKACARHGLGLYIYAGEDLPVENKPVEKPLTALEIKTLTNMCKKKGKVPETLFKVPIKDLTGDQYAEAIKRLGELPDVEGA